MLRRFRSPLQMAKQLYRKVELQDLHNLLVYRYGLSHSLSPFRCYVPQTDSFRLLYLFIINHISLDPSITYSSYKVDAALSWVSLAISVPLIWFLVYLMGFHTYITYHGISTFENILYNRFLAKYAGKLKVSYKCVNKAINDDIEWRG